MQRAICICAYVVKYVPRVSEDDGVHRSITDLREGNLGLPIRQESSPNSNSIKKKTTKKKNFECFQWSPEEGIKQYFGFSAAAGVATFFNRRCTQGTLVGARVLNSGFYLFKALYH